MSIVNAWQGAVTDSGARVVAKLNHAASNARLLVDTNAGFTAPTFFGEAAPSSESIVDLEAVNLTANTRYFWAIQHEPGVRLPGLSGSYVSTPDNAALDITGDLDIAAECTFVNWQNSAADNVRSCLVGKWPGASQRSYALCLEDAGTLTLFWSAVGTTSINRVSTAAVPFTANQRGAVRATLDVNNGAAGHTVTFYTGPTIAGPWTQLGAPVVTAGVTSIFSGTGQGSVGALDTGTGRFTDGIIHSAVIRSGILGTIVANPVFTDQTHNDTSFTDAPGRVWTVNGTAEIVIYEDGTTGQFLTHPLVGQAANFSVLASACAGTSPVTAGTGSTLNNNRLSNHEIFDAVRTDALANDDLCFIHMGDLHYYDLGSGSHGIAGGGSLSNYRRGYDDVLLQSRQHELYRNVPLVYMYDDHDWGPNNSDGTIAGRNEALQAYRERVPYYPLPESGTAPNYHSFQIGRVLFAVLDCRSSRSPNAAADGPSKTMLGANQKAWLETLLSTTTAQFLVVVVSSQWEHPSSTDTFFAFNTERNELLNIFEAPDGDSSKNWLGRMCVVQGDAHSAGIRSGANNPFGGFPVYQFASLDSSATGFQSWKDVGSFSSPANYGRLSFVDTGTTLTLTGTAFHRDEASGVLTELFSLSIEVQTDEPPEPPEPPPAPSPTPVAHAAIRRHVTWYGCDLVTGRIIAELPDTMGQISRVIGAYTNTQLSIPIPGGGHGNVGTELIREATTPRRTMMVNVINDIPAWGGIVLTRKGGTAATIDLGLASIENYLEQRYVGAHEWTDADVASTIAAGLIGDSEDEGIGFVVDAPSAGITATRQYFDQDDATIYSRLQELCKAVGIEWTVDLDWEDDTHQVLRKIIRVYPRIGVSYGGQPPAVFQALGGSVFSSAGVSDTKYVLTEEHTRGRSANHVVAYSSGEAEDRPQSSPARDEVALAAGAPRFELRFSPSSSIITLDVLEEHAAAELARRRDGALLWSIESRWDAYPRYGVDWQLGDDVAWQVRGHWHPTGIIGAGRALGWELDVQSGTLGLILKEEE